MSSPKKKGVNPRAKGRRGEVKIRDYLTEWTGLEFHRCPSSGAFGTINKQHDLIGDVYTKDPHFPWSVEVKNVESTSVEGLIKDSKTILFKFWNQTENQAAKAKKWPLLLFLKAHSPVFFMMDPRSLPEDFKGPKFVFESAFAPGIGRDIVVVIGMLKDLMQCSYAAHAMKVEQAPCFSSL